MKMNTMKMAAACLGAALLAAPALAGGKGYHCDMDTQKCLDELAANLKNRGWVGIEMDDSEEGKLTITRVVPGSPAEAAGFHKGDLLLAVNDIRFADKDSEAKLKKNKDTMVPGAKVQYTVGRGGAETKLDVTLGKLPSDVLAQWVGMHMMEHAKVEIAQK